MTSFLHKRKREILTPEEILARAMDALAYEVTRLQTTSSMGAPLEKDDSRRLIEYTKLLNETIKVKQDFDKQSRNLRISTESVETLLLKADNETDLS